MSEQQASEEQTSTEEQSQTDSRQGAEQQQASEQTSELKEVKDLPDWAQKLIRDTRKESETYRKQVKQFEDSQKTDSEKLLSRAETAETELAKARSELRDIRSEETFVDAATKANARSPRLLFRAYKSELAFDDDGKITNLDTVIQKAMKDEPDLFRKASGRGDGGRHSTTNQDIKPGVDRIRHAYGQQADSQ